MKKLTKVVWPKWVPPQKFTFEPTSQREWVSKPYTGKPKLKNAWIAPEHSKGAMGMERAYPLNDRGERIPGRGRELVVDRRPEIMVPKPEPRFLAF